MAPVPCKFSNANAVLHSYDKNKLTTSRFATTYSRSIGGKATERSLYLLRSYEHENSAGRSLAETLPIKNFGPPEPMQIWQVARAATAAPFYFKEIVFSPNGPTSKIHYSDGGFGSNNNPTDIAINELNLLHGAGKLGVIVSIGTAKADNQGGGQSAFAHTTTAYQIATNPNVVHDFVRKQNQSYEHYWRLNDEGGLKIALDHWKPSYLTRKPGHRTIRIMRERFAIWLRENRDVDRQFDACAAELVQRRRARAQHEHLWECFATGVSKFKCKNLECRREDVKYYSHRGGFEEHWRRMHSDEENAADFKEPLVTRWDYQGRS